MDLELVMASDSRAKTTRPVRGPLRACAMVLLCALALPVQAQDLADKLRAAFIYNFAKFVTWPEAQQPAAGAPIRLCVLTDPEFAALLARTVANKQVGQHPLEVVDAGEPSELQDCDVAYFPQLDSAAQTAMARKLSDGALTVHQADSVNAAGVVRFYLQDRKIRLEINSRAADAAQLKISAKLLSLAQVVQG